MLQCVGGTQHEQTAMQVHDGFLRHDRTGVQAVTQHHNSGGHQRHRQYQPGEQAPGGFGKPVDEMGHTGEQTHLLLVFLNKPVQGIIGRCLRRKLCSRHAPSTENVSC